MRLGDPTSFLGRRWLNLLLIGLSLLMVAFIALGVLSKGKPGSVTWGPTVDIWAASIALDDAYTGKMDGLGRRETALAAAQFLTDTHEDMRIGKDSKLVADPAKVEQAWKAAADIYTPELPKVPTDSRLTISVMAEDIGYSDFYAYAFRIFGVHGMSTYYLCLTLLTLSVVLFAAGNWRSPAALAWLTFATAAFFLLTTGGQTFTSSAPHIAANRFLATLVVIPALHVLAFALDRGAPKRDELGFFITQALLFAFLVTLRSSAAWALVGLIGIGFVILAVRIVRWRLGGAQRPQGFLASAAVIPGMARLAGSILLVALLASGWQSYRASQLSIAYENQDILPHHLRWHSAALGLSLHPEWRSVVPWPDLKTANGDGIGMLWYSAYMRSEMPNTPELSTMHGSYRYGWSEVVMKEEVSSFITQHPLFAVQLYLFHKPVRTVQEIGRVVGSIPALAWLLVLPSLLMGGLALVSHTSNRSEQLTASGLFAVASWAPVIWAYPAQYVVADQTYAALFFALSLLATIGAAAYRAKGGLHPRLQPAEPTPVAG